ncbi:MULTISPECIES: hypothetical protein [unclassified Agrococcus]
MPSPRQGAVALDEAVGVAVGALRRARAKGPTATVDPSTAWHR